MEVTLRPIGVVHNQIPPGTRRIARQEVESEIVINPEWVDALEGVEGFSHLWVIFHFSQSPSPETPRVHPQGRDDVPFVGIFSTRSPVRPNPIGLALVELLALDGNRLCVRGLDAFDGTPVLDLKPYLPEGDSSPQARVPHWLVRLQIDKS
jgi:tRNA-Thr(GGU) m(6)t(6)A37 methyltransferase TsaA